MLVVATMWFRKELQSVKVVFTATLFSHSNSAHMFLQARIWEGTRCVHWSTPRHPQAKLMDMAAVHPLALHKREGITGACRLQHETSEHKPGSC